jgi:ferredoxin
MECAVIYFSLTGNTEKVARAIGDGIRQVTEHCDLLPIKEANPKRLYRYDLIGLGSCVIGDPPQNVANFIKDMMFLGGKHVFSFCTHCTIGVAYNPTVIRKLHAKGMIPIGWNDWYGHSWGPIHQPTPYPTDGHPDATDLAEGEEWGRQLAWLSQKIYAGASDLIPRVPDLVPFPDMGDDSVLKNYSFPKTVKFHQEKCLYPKCRLCMDYCPMDGIDLSVDPPIVAKPCLSCQFCEQICPTGAIDADLEKQKALHRHISDTLQRVGLAHLKNATAAGKFRSLIPDEKVDWETPVYEAFPEHPRFVIGRGRQ